MRVKATTQALAYADIVLDICRSHVMIWSDLLTTPEGLLSAITVGGAMLVVVVVLGYATYHINHR